MKNNLNALKNPLFNTDGYKLNHIVQMPEGTNFIYSNFTPRSNKYFKGTSLLSNHQLTFVGIKGFVETFLITDFNKNFFSLPKKEACESFFGIITNYVGPLPKLFDSIEQLHDLQYLPIELKALPEGSNVNPGIPVFTVFNTHQDFYWLPGYLEDVLSNQNWKTSTIASLAFQYRYICELYAKNTCDDNSHVKFQCHDFSQRGLSGMADSLFNSIGHLSCFVGSDNIPSIAYSSLVYTVDDENYMYGATVPATEHSVMCMGTKDNEAATYDRLINKLYPTGIVSIVSDTWDLWNVINNILPSMKDSIMNRDGKVVIRPDSGNPIDILCGDIDVIDYDSYPDKTISFKEFIEKTINTELNYYSKFTNIECNEIKSNIGFNFLTYSSSNVIYIKYQNMYYSIIVKFKSNIRNVCNYIINYADNILPKNLGVIELLWREFGGTINSKGYKVLDPHVGVLYGDSITIERAEAILKKLKEKGFASSNIIFGVGSYTYQMITRDTFGFAMKATYGEVNSTPINLLKDPVTDDGVKKSRTGLLQVTLDENRQYVCKNLCTKEEEQTGCLKTVFKNGICYSNTTLEDIRNNIDKNVEYLLNK